MDFKKEYDVIIVGGGPAGLSAAIYTARARLSTLLVEKMAVGGQIINALMVDNYPGYKDGVSGVDLTMSMHEQATKFGVETLSDEVTSVKIEGGRKVVTASMGEFASKAVIIAGGAAHQKINVPGEKEYTGKGVSYCATCDGAFYRDKTVAVLGGGNSAVTEALGLTKFASKIYLVHRRHELRAAKILQEKLLSNIQIQPVWDTAVEAITGKQFVEKVKIKNLLTDKTSELDVAGVFVSIGTQPDTDYLKSVVNLDAGGAIIVNDRLETSVPGIFAAGDIRSGSIKQVVAAAGDGAIAAVNAGKYISG
jgi:thioredoxin reductase (NADPH)